MNPFNNSINCRLYRNITTYNHHHHHRPPSASMPSTTVTPRRLSAPLCSCSCLPHPAHRRCRPQFLEQYTAAGLRFYLNPRTNDVRWSPPKSRRRDASRGTNTAAAAGSGPAGVATGADASSADTSDSNTSRGGSLPNGWEVRTTPAGRPYYVNHAQRITQWTPPDSGSAAAAATAAATGAGEQKSPYRDQSPAAAFVPSSTSPVGFGVTPAAQHLPSAQVPLDSGDVGVGHGVAAAGGVGGLGLPGYIEIRTHADGRTYYVNHRTKVTSWAPPPKEDW